MRWSLMTYTVHAGQPGGLETLEEIADLARELQFRALELSARDLAGREPEEIAELCASRGLAISCINGPADLAAADDAAFASGLVQAGALIDAAAEMRCPVVMLIPGRAEHPDDRPRAAARIAEGLREAVTHASSRDVTVTIEDFPNPLAPYASVEEVRHLLDEVPGLRLTFDNGNWLVGGDDPVDAAREFADEIANCHVKDWEPDPQQARIRLPSGSWIRGGLHGEGILDHRAILSALVEIGYNGYMAFEYEGLMDHVKATRRGMEHLRTVLSEILPGRAVGRDGGSGT
ncbi:MAG: sugar phosphate isomerase/epimerase family protein [Armatimonadota bacterium]